MAIEWGAWEGSGNQMRVGIDVSWEAITHGEAAATATVKYYTQNNFSWDDDQTLNLTGNITGSQGFHNGQGDGVVSLRETRTYTYNYPSSSYGSSPGSRTFGASVSGAYNGITPSKSVSTNIPARPYGAPAAPTNVNTTRVSETSAKTTWTNRDTAGEPWNTVRIQIDGGDNGAWNGDVGTTGGGGTSFTDTGLISNSAYRWRVRSENSIDDSAYVEGDLIYTTPAAPTNLVRTGANGANQVLTWSNDVSIYVDHRIAVERSVNGGAWTQITETGRNTTTYTDTYGATHPAERIKYRVRARTNGGAQGTLYSGYSNTSTETSGVTTPPSAPTGMSPDGNTVINPNFTKLFSWVHHSTDTSVMSGFQIQWRVVGGPTWTVRAKVVTATPSTTLPVATFPDNSDIEWQVRTWGGATTGGSDGTGASPFSASALFKTVGDPNLFRERKRVMRLDLDTGKPETATVGVLPPIGSILMFGGAAAPSGWLICDGSSVSRTTYQNLYGVIGNAFGAGDGSTTFNLPDMRSRLPAGVGVLAAMGQSEAGLPAGVTGTPPAESAGRDTRMSHTHDHASGTIAVGSSGSGHTHNIPGQPTAASSITGGTASGAAARKVDYDGHAHGGDTGTSGSGHTHDTSSGRVASASGIAVGTVHAYQAFNFIIKI
jgi:microcystin-dependent protein